MNEFENATNKKTSDHHKQDKTDCQRRSQSPPKKKMTEYIYRSFKENNNRIGGWVREELIQSN